MRKNANGEGSITKRKDGRWQGSVCVGRSDSGKLIRKYFYGKTRKEVSNQISEVIKSVRNDTYILSDDNPTSEQWLYKWLWSYKRNSVKEKTFDQYETLMLDMIKDLGEKLQNRDEDAVKKLMEALVGVGIAMAYVGNSRPASGSEHHLSHFFEIVGILKNEPYFMHGTDVAYSSVYTQKLREELLCIDMPTVGTEIDRTTDNNHQRD